MGRLWSDEQMDTNIYEVGWASMGRIRHAGCAWARPGGSYPLIFWLDIRGAGQSVRLWRTSGSKFYGWSEMGQAA